MLWECVCCMLRERVSKKCHSLACKFISPLQASSPLMQNLIMKGSCGCSEFQPINTLIFPLCTLRIIAVFKCCLSMLFITESLRTYRKKYVGCETFCFCNAWLESVQYLTSSLCLKHIGCNNVWHGCQICSSSLNKSHFFSAFVFISPKLWEDFCQKWRQGVFFLQERTKSNIN